MKQMDSITTKAYHQASLQGPNTQEKKSHLGNFVDVSYISMELKGKEFCFLIAAQKNWVLSDVGSTTSSTY